MAVNVPLNEPDDIDVRARVFDLNNVQGRNPENTIIVEESCLRSRVDKASNNHFLEYICHHIIKHKQYTLRIVHFASSRTNVSSGFAFKFELL